MAIALGLTILASLLWAITNHTDRFLVNGVDQAASSIKTLMVFSTLIAGTMAGLIWLGLNGWQIPEINLSAFLLVLASAGSYVIASYLYFHALDGNETSRIVVLYQLIPVFSYILGIVFLGEVLTLRQTLGSIIIVLAAVLISLDFRHKKSAKRSQHRAFWLMILSCLAFAIYYLLFDLSREQGSYNATAFWYQVSMALAGLIFILIPSFRHSFVQAIKSNGKIYVPLNLLNELLNSTAVLLANFAAVTLPLALVNVMNGFQPAFTFIIGAIGVKTLPKFFQEDLSRRAVYQKLGCIALSLIGLAVIFL